MQNPVARFFSWIFGLNNKPEPSDPEVDRLIDAAIDSYSMEQVVETLRITGRCYLNVAQTDELVRICLERMGIDDLKLTANLGKRKLTAAEKFKYFQRRTQCFSGFLREYTDVYFKLAIWCDSVEAGDYFIEQYLQRRCRVWNGEKPETYLAVMVNCLRCLKFTPTGKPIQDFLEWLRYCEKHELILQVAKNCRDVNASWFVYNLYHARKIRDKQFYPAIRMMYNILLEFEFLAEQFQQALLEFEAIQYDNDCAEHFGERDLSTDAHAKLLKRGLKKRYITVKFIHDRVCALANIEREARCHSRGRFGSQKDYEAAHAMLTYGKWLDTSDLADLAYDVAVSHNQIQDIAYSIPKLSSNKTALLIKQALDDGQYSLAARLVMRRDCDFARDYKLSVMHCCLHAGEFDLARQLAASIGHNLDKNDLSKY